MRTAVTILCVMSAVALSARAGQKTFRTGVDIVGVSATVVDKKGNLLTDLAEGDFEVYEDGQRQELKYFVACDAQAGRGASATPLPPTELHLGALFDISGSMEADMQLARSAAIRFLNALQEARDYTLVDFDTEIRVARYSQSEFGRLVERIRSRKAEGNTALWDATGVYLDGASDLEGRKVLVLYTDGGDNASSLSFDDLSNLLKASDVTVHAIGFLEHQSAGVKLELRSRLLRLAELAGGQAFFPQSVRDLDKVYTRVAAEIDAQYSMGYVSSNTRTDGTWRKVEVRVTRPGLKDIKVRARQGYFAPRRPFKQ